MKKRNVVFLVAAVMLLSWVGKGFADYIYRDGNGTLQTIFAFTCQSTKICPAQTLIPQTSNGWTTLTCAGALTCTAITNGAQAIKASAGWLGKVQCDNNNNAWTYLQIYNTASGSVSVGTTAPAVILPLAPNLSNGFVANAIGEQFSTAISVAATTTPTGASAPATSALNCSFDFN